VLFVSDRPELASALVVAFRAAAVLLLLGAVARLVQRLRLASPLMRRMLAPVLIVFVLRMLSLAIVVATVRLSWLPVLLTAAVPAAIGWGLLAGRLWIARTLQELVSGLRSTPSRETLQPLTARARRPHAAGRLLAPRNVMLGRWPWARAAPAGSRQYPARDADDHRPAWRSGGRPHPRRRAPRGTVAGGVGRGQHARGADQPPGPRPPCARPAGRPPRQRQPSVNAWNATCMTERNNGCWRCA
jgi:hypothetical protein